MFARIFVCIARDRMLGVATLKNHTADGFVQTKHSEIELLRKLSQL